ncbi:MAG: glycosyltransferase family 2 protein [Nocardioidaceae bacterium]
MPTKDPSVDKLPSISVVVCVYTEDRWDAIVESVYSAKHQTLPPREVVVVVDHNPSLLSRCSRELPGTVVLPSAGHPGLAGARNTGVAKSEGAVIAFLDDDAWAEPDWLARLLPHYTDPAVLGVGGGIVPDWGGPRPARLPREFDWVVGCSYVGLPTDASQVRNVIGANMSIRRTVFDAVGGFAQGLGRVRSRPAGCEETELCIRASARIQSGCFIYEPGAVVHHQVGAERQTWAYFRSRCFAEGRSKAVVAGLVGAGPGLAAERTYVRRDLPRGVLTGMRDSVHGDPSGLVRAGWIVAGVSFAAAGYAAGSVTASRERRRPRSLTPPFANSGLVTIPGGAVVATPQEG